MLRLVIRQLIGPDLRFGEDVDVMWLAYVAYGTVAKGGTYRVIRDGGDVGLVRIMRLTRFGDDREAVPEGNDVQVSFFGTPVQVGDLIQRIP